MSNEVQGFAQRILASTETSASHTWSDISFRFPMVNAMLNALVRVELQKAMESGEFPKGKPGVSQRAIEMSWRALEKKLFKNYDTFVEFNGTLDQDQAMKAVRAHDPSYFTTDKWLKDVGPIGKKVKSIVETTVWDSL